MLHHIALHVSDIATESNWFMRLGYSIERSFTDEEGCMCGYWLKHPKSDTRIEIIRKNRVPYPSERFHLAFRCHMPSGTLEDSLPTKININDEEINLLLSPAGVLIEFNSDIISDEN